MNKQEGDIMNALLKEPFINQRILAETSGHSLGVVNRSIKELIKSGYLDEKMCPTLQIMTELKEKAPKNAIILAAGYAHGADQYRNSKRLAGNSWGTTY